MVSLPGCIFVKSSEIHHTTWASVRLGCYNHSVAPGYWVIYWHFLKDPKLTISVKTSFDISLPVEGDLAGCVNSNRFSIVIHKNAKWWRAIHERKWLIFTAVECTALVPVQYVLLQDW